MTERTVKKIKKSFSRNRPGSGRISITRNTPEAT